MLSWYPQNPTTGLYPELSAHFLKIHLNIVLYSSGSQSVLRRSQGIRDHFPKDPLMHFCNGNIEVYLFFKLYDNILLKTIKELL
jgi:hypothetical protein